MYAYRNLETGAIVLSEHPLSRYEHSEKWESADPDADDVEEAAEEAAGWAADRVDELEEDED